MVNTFSSRNVRMLPKMPPWVRFAMAGVILALFAFSFWQLSTFENAAEPDPGDVLERVVRVPTLDEKLLVEVRDTARSDRLQVEREPLRHLLAKAIDVGPSVAAALQIPDDMVPVSEVVEAIDKWRYRWLWYEGRLTQISAPRKGHPIDGYSIIEATVQLEDGRSVMAAFSVEPKDKLQVGDWVRTEGYLFKLRDITYPETLDKVPMLVGRSLQRDFEDWPKITELDQSLFEGFDDSSMWPEDLPARTVEEDQTEILWHLGAFVRDTAKDRTLKDWRKIEPLTTAEPYDRLVNGEVGRGEPMRVFGTLIRRHTIAAPANPANIKFWTAVWIQVHGFGGHLIPIWVPGKVDELPMRAQLEVRGFYYRWFVYDGKRDRFKVPLFVAADLDLFELDTDETMIEIGIWIGSAVTLMFVLILWSQRRTSRGALAHSKQMDARRRKRREHQAALATGAQPGPPPLPPTDS